MDDFRKLNKRNKLVAWSALFILCSQNDIDFFQAQTKGSAHAQSLNVNPAWKNRGLVELKKRKKFCSEGIEIIAIVVIWALVILAISNVLDGTPYMSRISHILSGGSFASILILYNLRKKKREE